MAIDADGRALIDKRNRQLGAGRGDFFFSPDEVANEQEQVNRLVDSLGVDVNAQQAKLPATTVRGFAQFWNEWKHFYADRSGWLSRHERSTYEKTLQYRDQADAWRKKLAKAGADLAAGQVTAGKPPQSDGNKVLIYIGVGAIVLVGIVLAAKIVHVVALGDSEPGDEEFDADAAEAEALAIIEKKRQKRHARSVLSIA